MPVLYQTLKGSSRGLHTDKLLTQILKSRGVPRDYAWKNIWSGIPVDKMTDLIARIDPDNEIALYDAMPMGAEGLLERASFNVLQPISYELQTFGMEAMIPSVYRTAADDIFDFSQRQGAYIIDRLNLRLEYAAIVQTLRNSAVMTFNTTVPAAQRWSNRGSPDSNPIADLKAWVRFVREESNREIQNIYLTAPVWDEIAQHPVVLGRADVTTWREITPEVLEKLLRLPAGTIKVDNFGIYKAPGSSGLGAKRYFGGPDVVITTGGGPSRSDNTFGHMYYLGGSGDDPIVTMRYPEFRSARFAEVVQSTVFCHFLVESPTSAFVAFNVVDPTLSRYRSMLSG